MAENPIDDSIPVLFNDQAPDRFVGYMAYLEKQAQKVSGKEILTGFLQLDNLCGGFQPGEMIVITGPTANGKTLFAETLGYRMMTEEKKNIGWFSFEVPTASMLQKYREQQNYAQLGLYVPLELVAGNFGWLKQKCLEAKVRHQCEVVVIDHLHFLVDMNTQQNMSLNIGAVMRKIKKEIAIPMHLVVFVIAHQAQRKDAEPSIDNIRDSSFIAQEADTVFVIFRTADPVPQEFANNAKIPGYPMSFDQGFCAVKIEKARRTGVYRKRLNFQKNGYWLEECL